MEEQKIRTTNLPQIQFYFYRAFALFHQGIVIIVTFKMLHIFLLKRTIKTFRTNKILSIRITLLNFSLINFIK